MFLTPSYLKILLSTKGFFMKKRNLFFGLVCLGALMLSACGGGSKGNSNKEESSKTTPSSQTTSSSETTPSSSEEQTSSEEQSSEGSSSQSESSEPEHVHNFEFSQFIWTKTPGAYTAVARYVCAEDDEHQDHDAVVTQKSNTAAKCEADGQIVWHAEYDGHEDEQIETLNALGHVWGEPTWQWSGLHSSATATFTCTRDPEHTHQETATVENGGIVLYEHLDETCVANGYDIYRATITFEGKEYFDDWKEDIPATEHSDVDPYGFCEKCGQYQGEEIDDPDMNKEFAELKAGIYYYRFAFDTDILYKKVLHNIPSSEVYFFGLRNDAWEDITISASQFTAIEDTDDGYVYITLLISATCTNAYFRFDMECAHPSVDAYGFCDRCGQYLGFEITKDQWNTQVECPAGGSDEMYFMRFEIDNEHHFTFIQDTNWIQAFEGDDHYYLRAGDTFTEILPSEFYGMDSTQLIARKNAKYFFKTDGRPNDGYLYFVGQIGGQEELLGSDKLNVSTEHLMNTATGFCYGGDYMGTEINIGETVNIAHMAKNAKAYYRFEDPGDFQLMYDCSHPQLVPSDFAFYRMDENGQFAAITMQKGTLNQQDASSDGYYYLVITAGGMFDNGSFSIQMEDVLTVAFYAKFMDTEVRVPEMEAAITEYFETHGDCDKVIFVVLGDGDTNVAALADLMTEYNDEHPLTDIDILLGAKADKDGALVSAGYAQVSSTSYSYGTDNGRRLWCKAGLEASANVLAMQEYLAANWAA